MERLGMNGCGVRLLNAGISNPSIHKIIREGGVGVLVRSRCARNGEGQALKL